MNKILKRLEEGTLIRQDYERTEDGKHLACLFVALAGEGCRPEDCPSSLMPEWFAHLTVWINDAGTEAHWPEVVRRYAQLSETWSALSSEEWALLEFRIKRQLLLFTLNMCNAKVSPSAAVPVHEVLRLLNRTIAGKTISPDEWYSAGEAAETYIYDSLECMTVAWVAKKSCSAGESLTAGTAWYVSESLKIKSDVDSLIDRVLSMIEEEIGVSRLKYFGVPEKSIRRTQS